MGSDHQRPASFRLAELFRAHSKQLMRMTCNFMEVCAIRIFHFTLWRSVLKTPAVNLQAKKQGLPASPTSQGKPLFGTGFWKRQARTWHWMSGAVCLIGMLLFAFTGITLNHAGDIPASPKTIEKNMVLSDTLLNTLKATDKQHTDAMPLPLSVRKEIQRSLGIHLRDTPAEWTDFDVYLAQPGPGGDAWLSIDFETGEVFYEATSRGAISFLNDLHKGRDTGLVWKLFLDVFALACMVFCLTGLWLLQIHSMRRPSTWPLAITGIALPVLLLLFFLHM